MTVDPPSLPTKQCYRCKRHRVYAFFYRARHTKDGLQDWCKDCTREYNTERAQRAVNDPNYEEELFQKQLRRLHRT